MPALVWKSSMTNLVLPWAAILIVLITISIPCSTSKSTGPAAQLTQYQAASQLSNPVPPLVLQQGGPCTLKVSDLAVMNGLKLGMTVDEILALFPGSKQDAELRTALSAPPGRFGNSTLLITPSKYGSAESYRESSRLSFSFLDGRLSNFTISYNGPQWPDVDKFIEKFTEGKNLPSSNQWEVYPGMDNQMKTLSCNGFSIRIFAGGDGGGQNYVLVEDLKAEKELKDRRKKAREQASPTSAARPSR